MTTQLERIENELRLAGYKLEPVKDGNWTDDDYVQNIGNCVWEICKLFCNQGHSGMSASFTLQILEKLLIKEDTLTPLTNNPAEWLDCSEMSITQPMFQSKRKFSCFSDDNLKTYYDVNDKKSEKKPLKDFNEKENERS